MNDVAEVSELQWRIRFLETAMDDVKAAATLEVEKLTTALALEKDNTDHAWESYAVAEQQRANVLTVHDKLNDKSARQKDEIERLHQAIDALLRQMEVMHGEAERLLQSKDAERDSLVKSAEVLRMENQRLWQLVNEDGELRGRYQELATQSDEKRKALEYWHPA